MRAFYPLSLIAAAALGGCAQLGGVGDIGDAVGTVTPAAPTQDGIVRRAVVFGLDHVDAMAYGGWTGECPGTIEDATRMRDLLVSRGYSVVFLTNNLATSFRVTAACVASAQGMKPGDKLYVYGSSHGGQVPDITGQEADGMSETICLYDMQYVDDLVYAMLVKVPEGVEVDLETDCCNSGSNYRSPRDFARLMRARQRAAPGTVVCSFTHYGGCGDGESSYGSKSGGAFTNARLATGPGDLTRLQWFEAAKAKMPRNQIPVFGELGPSVKNGKAMR